MYDGEFVRNQKEGKGLYKFEDSDQQYEGEFYNGKFHGQGKFEFNQYDFYEGQFENNEFHGKGKLVFKKQTYDGDFNNGQKHGKGTLEWEDDQKQNIKYDGEWIKDNQDHDVLTILQGVE